LPRAWLAQFKGQTLNVKESIKNEKFKINENLVTELVKNFAGSKKHVDLKAMKEYYFKLYSDSILSPKKEEKKENIRVKRYLKVWINVFSPPVIKKAPPSPPWQSKINLQVVSHSYLMFQHWDLHPLLSGSIVKYEKSAF